MKSIHKSFPISLMIILLGCVPLQTTTNYTSKKLVFHDFNYENKVGMVRVYPTGDSENQSMEYPIANINERGMSLSFDLLEENYKYIQARLIHCNADWSRSNLSDIQFLDSYNEFSINDYEYSANTRIPYVHYDLDFPMPKISGNYLIAVYNEGNEQDLLFVRRFMVFSQNATVDLQILRSDLVSVRQENQQLEFSIKYDAISNPNPMSDFKVALLQNHNWNTAITDLKPTLVRNDQKYMEYKHFNGENNFKGLTEFRFFDLRSIDYRGMNVSHIDKDPSGITAHLNPDKSRGDLAYTQINEDLNGNYFLENTDPGDSPRQSEYLNVEFTLQNEEINGDVFVTGLFNNWNLSPKNLMVYDPAVGAYKASILMKQGYYNYQYWVESESIPDNYFEGSNFQTQNIYEILLYYRNPSLNYGQLIGYKKALSRN